MSKLFNSILQGFKEFGEITNNKSLLNQIDEIETSETFEEGTIRKSVYTIDYVDNTGAGFKDHIKASSEEDALKKFNKKSKNFVNGVRKIKGHPYIDYLDDDASYDEIDDLTEDTQLKFDGDMINDIDILYGWRPQEVERILIKHGSDKTNNNWIDGLDLPAAYDEIMSTFRDKYSDDDEIDYDAAKVLGLSESLKESLNSDIVSMIKKQFPKATVKTSVRKHSDVHKSNPNTARGKTKYVDIRITPDEASSVNSILQYCNHNIKKVLDHDNRFDYYGDVPARNPRGSKEVILSYEDYSDLSDDEYKSLISESITESESYEDMYKYVVEYTFYNVKKSVIYDKRHGHDYAETPEDAEALFQKYVKMAEARGYDSIFVKIARPIFLGTSLIDSDAIKIYSDGEIIKDNMIDESLKEAKKLRAPKFWNTNFSDNVIKDYEAGKLTFDNIEEWDIAYNDGRKPNPPFNTKEILDYYLATKESFKGEDDKMKLKINELIEGDKPTERWAQIDLTCDSESCYCGNGGRSWVSKDSGHIDTWPTKEEAIADGKENYKSTFKYGRDWDVVNLDKEIDNNSEDKPARWAQIDLTWDGKDRYCGNGGRSWVTKDSDHIDTWSTKEAAIADGKQNYKSTFKYGRDWDVVKLDEDIKLKINELIEEDTVKNGDFYVGWAKVDIDKFHDYMTSHPELKIYKRGSDYYVATSEHDSYAQQVDNSIIDTLKSDPRFKKLFVESKSIKESTDSLDDYKVYEILINALVPNSVNLARHLSPNGECYNEIVDVLKKNGLNLAEQWIDYKENPELTKRLHDMGIVHGNSTIEELTDKVLKKLDDNGYDTSDKDVRNYAEAAAELIINDVNQDIDDWYSETLINYPEDLEELPKK